MHESLNATYSPDCIPYNCLGREKLKQKYAYRRFKWYRQDEIGFKKFFTNSVQYAK